MKKTKFSLRRLFSNTKFLVLFSVVLAFIFWIIVALEYAPVVENVIKDVPVVINTENSVPDKLGLQIFGQKDFKIDITVKGNRYDIGGDLLTADDFDVTAQTAYVNSAGNHTLQIKVVSKRTDIDFEILGYSQDYIEVYFDKYEEKEFSVTPRIITKLDSVVDGEFLFDEKDIILATQAVTVSGAKAEIDKIDSVYANIIVDKKLSESKTVDCPLDFNNYEDEDPQYISVKGNDSMTVPVTLPVYKIEQLPVSVTFRNSPADFVNAPLAYTPTPSSARVAVMQNGGEAMETLNVGVIDFSNLDVENHVFTFNAEDLENIKVLDGTKTFRVNVSTTGLSSVKFELKQSNVSITGAANASSYVLDLGSTGAVTVVGKNESVSVLTSDSVYARIDLTGVTISTGKNRVPMTVYVKDYEGCWVSGTYYAVINA